MHSGVDSGLDSGSDSGVDSGVDSMVDSGVDSVVDSGDDSGRILGWILGWIPERGLPPVESRRGTQPGGGMGLQEAKSMIHSSISSFKSQKA